MALGIPQGIQICHVVKTINTGGYCINEREICCVCRNLYPGSSIGIHVYDVNVEEGTLKERKVVPVNNSSHLARSLNENIFIP